MAEHAQYFVDEKSRRIFMARQIILKVLVYLFLTVFALFMLAPFIFMVVGSFIEPESFKSFSKEGRPEYLRDWGFTNYQKIFEKTYQDQITGEIKEKLSNNFGVFFLNTFIVAVCSTTVTVVTAVLAAFAFARLEFKGKETLFALLLATMMVPGEMMVLTNFATVVEIDWTNTFAALILVHGVSVFYVFYLRQTFQQIPNELYLAAKVDGVSDIGYLLKVMVPIAMPTITTIIILSMMGAWNSYIWPNMTMLGGKYWKFGENVLHIQHSMLLVSNGLSTLFGESGSAMGYDSIKIAGSMIISTPLFIVFICFRKYIMKGVSRSGIKG